MARIARPLGDGNTVVYELGKRPSGRFTADVRVKRSRLTVRIDGRTKVDADVGYWKYPTNYFKAGGTSTWLLSLLVAEATVDEASLYLSLFWALLIAPLATRQIRRTDRPCQRSGRLPLPARHVDEYSPAAYPF